MKTTYFLLFLCGQLLAAQDATEQPLSIAISAPTLTVMAGSEVWITVKLTNHSHHEIDESGSINGMTGLDPNLVFTVSDLHGNTVAKRIYRHPELATGTPINRAIKDRETLTEEQRISRLYDMTAPGTYIVQVSRRSAAGTEREIVRSNTVTIKVVTSAEIPPPP